MKYPIKKHKSFLAIEHIQENGRDGNRGSDFQSPSNHRIGNVISVGVYPDSTLERIKVLTVLNRDQLVDNINDLPRLVVENDISLVVLDNLGKFFRLDIEGLADRRWLSNELLRIFETLCGVALMLDCVIVYTNQVYNQLSMFGDNRNAPVGDSLIGNMPTHRFFVRPS
ncbi:MAG: hypothetical protein ACTSSE_17470 [Candidatus Thorarchaeota archaeon]